MMENENEEKSLTLKSLKKEIDLKLAEIDNKIEELKREIKVVKKSLKGR